MKSLTSEVYIGRVGEGEGEWEENRRRGNQHKLDLGG